MIYKCLPCTVQNFEEEDGKKVLNLKTDCLVRTDEGSKGKDIVIIEFTGDKEHKRGRDSDIQMPFLLPSILSIETSKGDTQKKS